MDKLVESKDGPGDYRAHTRLMCPRCAGELFRAEDDIARLRPFALFRAEGGDLWYLHEGLMSGTGNMNRVVCNGCEDAREAARRPGQHIKLVAYDCVTGEVTEVDEHRGQGSFY